MIRTMTRATNPQLNESIATLKRISRKNKAKIWETMAEELGKSRRSRVVVNVGKIDRVSNDAKIVAIPGVVLGTGNVTRNITVGAFRFTEQARGKLERAGAKCLSLVELAQMQPKGSGVRILK
jgi:large subunit ribosomal protein L18e